MVNDILGILILISPVILVYLLYTAESLILRAIVGWIILILIFGILFLITFFTILNN